MWVKVSITDLG
jgi:hypothetical protein